MERDRTIKYGGQPSAPPPVTERAGAGKPTPWWLQSLFALAAVMRRSVQTFLHKKANRNFAAVGIRYVIAYTSLAVLGAYASILIFEGVDILRHYFLLATFSPIAIAFPIALHGVSLRVEAQRLGAQFKHLLDHDELTGLKSRRYVLEQLDLQTSPFNFVFMIDMDGLKHLNDKMGHLAGDSALKRLALVLYASTEKCDVVGRLSGDEFMLLTTADSAEKAASIASRTLKNLSSVNLQNEYAQAFTLSIGIAELSPGVDPFEAVHAADEALYNAKQRGGNTVQFAA